MSEDITPTDGTSGISRRDMLRRSALVGGAVVWVAPAIQTLAAPAFAAGSTAEENPPGNTYSEIAILVKCPDAVYRYKFTPQGAPVGALAPSDNGATFQLGTGQNESISGMSCLDFFRNDNFVTTDPAPLDVVASLAADGTVTISVVDPDCDIAAFAWHNGQCCFEKDGGTADASGQLSGVAPVDDGSYGSQGSYSGVTISGGSATAVFDGNPPNATCP